MYHPIQFAKPPDQTLYAADLFDGSWEQKNIHAYGMQGHFDVFADGEDDQGLRITIERGTHRIADETNGFEVTFVDGAADANLTSAMRTLVLTGEDGTTLLSALKTAVDAISGLDSDYFGGETGTNAVAMPPGVAGVVSGGTPDEHAWVVVTNAHNTTDAGLMQIGTSTPTNTNQATAVPTRSNGVGRLMLPGERLYTIRGGTNDQRGSVEMWRMSKSEFDTIVAQYTRR